MHRHPNRFQPFGQQLTTPPRRPSSCRPQHIVVIASSAGGLSALNEVLPMLPRSLNAAIVIAQHRGMEYPELLPTLLAAGTALLVKNAEAGEALLAGRVYVGPPGKHIAVTAARSIALFSAPPVRFVRPCADLLFQSAAEVFGPRAIALVLSGNGNDGAFGTRAIRAAGGTTIAQDERSSTYPSMPTAAVDLGCVDLVLPAASIGFAIEVLCGGARSPQVEPHQRGTTGPNASQSLS